MKTIRKLRMTIALLLLGFNVVAQVPRATTIDWSGTKTGYTNNAGTTETIRLTGDVNLTGNISVHGTLTIDLNGYVMKRNNMNYLVCVQNGGKLIVKDSRPTTKHYGKAENVAGPFDKTYPYLWSYNASYTASTPGAIEIEGGIMTGGIGTIAGCVFVNNGATFELQGGTLAGNFIYCVGGVYDAVEVNAMVRKLENHDEDNFFLKGGFGGGVFVAPTGTMNMTGGRICYNFASVCGGGVHNSGNFIMDNGRIDHNSTISEDFWGGGVYISHDPYYQPAGYGDALGDFTLNGGLIDYNTAASGGGVMVWENANFTMNGGAINYNRAGSTNGATGNGGAVYVQTGTFNFNQGEMRGNSAFRYGGAVNINQTAIFNLNGDCHIYENIADDGGGISQEAGDCVISLTNPGILIEDNVAYNDGGGLFVEKGTLTYSAGIVRNNTAGNNGGGIHIRVKRIAGDVNFNMTGGTVEGNQCGLRNQEDAVTATDYYRSGGGLCITADYPVEAGDSNDVVVNLSTAATFRNNGADGTYGEHGGGLYINVNTENSTAEVNVNTGALFDNNTARHDGGGFYLNSGSVKVNGGKVNNNNAGRNGGGVFIGGTTSSIVVSNTAEINGNTTQIDGGGFYADGGSVLVNTNSHVDENTATTGRGGGIFSKSGATFDNASVSSNTAVTGGGLYVASGSSSSIQTLIQNGSRVDGNNANNGAGACVESGILKVLDNTTQVNTNTASTSGGGIYMHSGNVEVTSAKVEGNTATSANGGGLYVGNGDITLSGAKVSGNSAGNGQGGGIYAGNGNILVKDDTQVGTYSAEAGSGNSAREGGGLYVNGGSVVFTGGTFAENYASEKGGGIYIKEGATLNLRETAELTGNHVPASGQGGGVYMNGTLNVGENAADPATKHSIIARDNYASDEVNPEITSRNRNNVFLPSDTKYITLLSDIHASNSKVGFSVTRGFCPVIYTDISDYSHEQWLYDLLGSTSGLTGAIFDDAQHYFALHVRHDQGPFEAKFDYLWGAWTTWVNKDPNLHTDDYPLPTSIEHHYTEETDGWHIYTREGLAWFISYVNGLNGCEEHHSANAFMENDVDMSGNLWVPIGGTDRFLEEYSIFTDGGEYKGNFDGQGHVIRNLDCRYLNAVLKIGLFGNVTGGSIKNTFVDGYEFTTQFDDKAYYLGGIAGRAMGGVISNCEARGVMSTDYCLSASSYMGGLVGMVDGATVHSSMAMPTMSGTARHMGGLMGQLNANNTLKNSFSNAEITRNDANSIIGGLVGTNLGTVENCYVRLRGSEPTGFGWFAGNNEGSIQYCYAPTGKTNYVNTGTAPVGSGNYGDTDFVIGNGKYGYAHQDQDVTATNDYVENGHIGNDGELKGLLATLNNWVEDQTDGVAYSTWTRTMASPMNADLPILEFDDFACASTRDNIFIAYRDDLNDMIDYANANSTGGSVYLYDATPTAVNKSTNGNVRVYIDPNVGITQADGNTLNARVGVTLDNSSTDFMAYDWHMFSSALQSAPMGLVYHSDEGTYYVRDNYGSLSAQGITHADYTDPTKMDPPMTTWNTTPGQIGYFPTDAPYGPWRNTGSLSQGFDFYCFHEPSRHWINFKREGREGFYDHWNQYVYNPATDKHTQIQYPNETAMVSGKGYMVPLRITS